MSEPSAPETQWPIRIDDVAKRLGKSVRWLRYYLAHNPAGRMAGRTRLFTEQDFSDLVESLPRAEGPRIPARFATAPRRRFAPAGDPWKDAAELAGSARIKRKPISAGGETWKEREVRKLRERRERQMQEEPKPPES